MSIESLADGSYEPRCLKRYYFSDEMVDQLHISDRIFQHILLRILKPTLKFVMNKNCYHLDGPTGVKNVTQKIREVLKNSNPKYFIRTDIKSFYKSILHYKLIQDVKKYYDDSKLIYMLTNIINNPIDTPYGYKNPDFGIALRGPLSQFFSGIYLKPLDDAFNNMDVTYLRYQDDILILRTVQIIPHARTLRKAREQIKMMVVDGASLCQIKNYLSRWVYWWVKTSSYWNYQELVNRYIDSCWDPIARKMAMGFFQQEATILRMNAQTCGRTLALTA